MASNILAYLYILLTFSFLLLVWVSIIQIVCAWVGHFKKWRRRRAVDRRVIAQAKAAGVWDKPQCLGGRALELKAWKLYRIKREPGEPDFYLRRRCMVKANAKSRKADGYTTKIMIADERHEEEPK